MNSVLCYSGENRMKNKDFCCVENFSVLIPYKDLEILMESANKIAHIEELVKRTTLQCSAMHNLYCEILEKVDEINRYLWYTHTPLCDFRGDKIIILLRWRRKCCFFASLLPPTLYISLLYAIRIVAKVILPLQLFALFHFLDRYTLPATNTGFYLAL